MSNLGTFLMLGFVAEKIDLVYNIRSEYQVYYQ